MSNRCNLCCDLRAVHRLVYRWPMMADEELMASLLANLIICLQSSAEIGNCLPSRSVNCTGGLKSMANLANEICGECVPRAYAPELKASMDRIQYLARKVV